MATKEVTIGSVGPYLYDDADGFDAVKTDGQLNIGEAPTDPNHVVRLQDLSAGGVMKEQIFLATGTWTCPADDTYVEVLIVGGGGGGGGASGGGAGSTGGTSSFGALASATGGTGGGYQGGAAGVGYNNGQEAPSGSTSAIKFGGLGGYGFNGYGHGGHGSPYDGTSGTNAGSGGGSGNVAFYTGTVSADQTVTVGAGGLKGGSVSTPGSKGVVIVRWLE